MMKPTISHDRKTESLRAKTLWFQSLTIEERMDYLCDFTDLVLENNPRIAQRKTEAQNAQSFGGRVLVLTKS